MSKLNILRELSILSMKVFQYSALFPKYEQYGLRSQLLRAMISVRLNIREGNTFYGDNKKRFFKIALGSLEEVDECMLIAKEWKYIEEVMYDNFKKQYWYCLNMLKKLISSKSSTK